MVKYPLVNVYIRNITIFFSSVVKVSRLPPVTCQALLESSGDVLLEIIVVEDGTLPAIQRPDLTGATGWSWGRDVDHKWM